MSKKIGSILFALGALTLTALCNLFALVMIAKAIGGMATYLGFGPTSPDMLLVVAAIVLASTGGFRALETE
jgi:hypothetical protein